MDILYAQNIIPPLNYYYCKSIVEILLRMKGLYQITLDTGVEQNSTIENYNYLNRMDETFEIIFYYIYPYLLYHVESNKNLNEFFTMLCTLFWTKDEMKGQQLEVELMKLRPCDFDSIQDFFTKLKYYILHPNMCNIKKYE